MATSKRRRRQSAPRSQAAPLPPAPVVRRPQVVYEREKPFVDVADFEIYAVWIHLNYSIYHIF